MTITDATPRWVYIFRDAAGTVLYVGCTARLHNRIAAHSRDKAWFGEVASVAAEVYPNRAAGEAAEAVLIQALRPKYERSPTMRAYRGDLSALPCRRCRRARHGECLSVNRRGEPCPCRVCARELADTT